MHVLAFDGLDCAMMGGEYRKPAVFWGLGRRELQFFDLDGLNSQCWCKREWRGRFMRAVRNAW